MNRQELLAGGRHPLSYCTNVHPAPDLEAAERVYRELAAPLLQECLGEGRQLCLGAWWPADVAHSLASDEALLERHGDLLDSLGLVPISLNLFPMGRFHGAPVKERVYEPDWSGEARLAYTLAAARAQAALLGRFGRDYGVMSSIPLGFRGADRDREPDEEHATNLFHVAAALEQLEKESGVHLVLALEPEPWCLLESVQETLVWLGDEAMAVAAEAGNEAAARRHLGLCLDLCHASVVGEDPVELVELCERSGIRIGKVQLSQALVARGPGGLEQLLAYDEPVWLHQTFLEGGEHGPFLDLSDPALRELELGEDDVLRSHFHVPLSWKGEEPLGSSWPELYAFLDLVRAGGLPEGVPLEVETYTNPSIAEELEFAAGYLLR